MTLTPLVLLPKIRSDSQVNSERHIQAEDVGLKFLSQSLAATALLVEL